MINFIKLFKWYIAHRAYIRNRRIRKKRREPRYRKLEKGEGRKKDFIFQNQKNREDLIICSVR